MADEIPIKRWNVVASDPVGIALIVDSCWTQWGANRQARFYRGLTQPVPAIEIDGVERPFTIYEVERAGA